MTGGTNEAGSGAALENLAERLHWKMWHLEPSEHDPDEEWAHLDELDRAYYRSLADFLVTEAYYLGLARPATTT
jgi:hypothetical protein